MIMCLCVLTYCTLYRLGFFLFVGGSDFAVFFRWRLKVGRVNFGKDCIAHFLHRNWVVATQRFFGIFTPPKIGDDDPI